MLGTLAIATLLVGIALSCFLVARRMGRLLGLRIALGIFAVIFLARGLLVVPFLCAGQREWHTPAGKIVVTGEWFATGSLVVLVIGLLICLGLYQTRSKARSLDIGSALPR
ncbi:hypothetical protein [Sphingomonas sp.]|uniref:hypothetical protein n=1 Tax=Sphingomonas sp. TaxID=28214 RepID=UPI003BA8A461